MSQSFPHPGAQANKLQAYKTHVAQVANKMNNAVLNFKVLVSAADVPVESKLLASKSFATSMASYIKELDEK